MSDEFKTSLRMRDVSHPSPPEIMLCGAVLVRALQDYAAMEKLERRLKENPNLRKNMRMVMEEKKEITDWFDCRAESCPLPMSFTWICQALSDDWKGLKALIQNYIKTGQFNYLFNGGKGKHKISTFMRNFSKKPSRL